LGFFCSLPVTEVRAITQIKDEELGVNELPTIKALPKKRINPGDGLRERVIAGDDLKRDVDRLPRKYQERIQIEIEREDPTEYSQPKSKSIKRPYEYEYHLTEFIEY
jgi:hypothetical protein